VKRGTLSLVFVGISLALLPPAPARASTVQLNPLAAIPSLQLAPGADPGLTLLARSSIPSGGEDALILDFTGTPFLGDLKLTLAGVTLTGKGSDAGTIALDYAGTTPEAAFTVTGLTSFDGGLLTSGGGTLTLSSLFSLNAGMPADKGAAYVSAGDAGSVTFPTATQVVALTALGLLLSGGGLLVLRRVRRL